MPMGESAVVLIVEDQEPVARAIALLLDLHGLPSVTVRTPAAALAAVAGRRVGLVIQDMNFSPGAHDGAEGFALFHRLRREVPHLPVLVMTAWASLEHAVRLVKEGAADYLEKPWDDDKLVATVRNLLRLGHREGERDRHDDDLRRARERLAREADLCGMVYRDAAVHEVLALAVRVAQADVPVLITGASGTGKEKLAEVLHANSARRGGPFVKVNAGAIPDSLLEAELFGAEAGAFTGATRRRLGRFEAADGGTLLLDEVGNLSPAGQMKLLRVLQTGEVERLGASRQARVDVRVLAATHADLRAEAAAGRFREDLLFRLDVIALDLPPLARRPADVLPLAEHFLQEIDGAPDDAPRQLSEASRRALLAHPWPGNVRELRNRVQRARLVARGTTLEPADLGLPAADAGVPRPPEGGRTPAAADAGTERERVVAALEAHHGVLSHAAAELGISRQALYRRMERLGIAIERRLRGAGPQR